MNENRKRFNVINPIERKDGKTSWLKIGVGFPNKDNSINLYLDALPTNGRLQLREADEDDKHVANNGDATRPIAKRRMSAEQELPF